MYGVSWFVSYFLGLLVQVVWCHPKYSERWGVVHHLVFQIILRKFVPNEVVGESNSGGGGGGGGNE